MDQNAFLSLQTKRKLLQGLYEAVSNQAQTKGWEEMMKWCEKNFDYTVRAPLCGALNTLRNDISFGRKKSRPESAVSWLDTLKIEQEKLLKAMKLFNENIIIVSHRISGKAEDCSLRSRFFKGSRQKRLYEVDMVLSVGWMKTVEPIYALEMDDFGKDRFVLRAKPISSSNNLDYFEVSTASPELIKDNPLWKTAKIKAEYLVVDRYVKTFGFGETLLDARMTFERRTRNKVRLTLLDAKKNQDA
jgi:hypothetical protein